MKYALVEMDRKFQELEKRTKAPAASAGRTTGRTGVAISRTGATTTSSRAGTGVNTPRGSSRAALGSSGAGATGTQEAR
jgi:hypothetical protein